MQFTYYQLAELVDYCTKIHRIIEMHKQSSTNLVLKRDNIASRSIITQHYLDLIDFLNRRMTAVW